MSENNEKNNLMDSVKSMAIKAVDKADDFKDDIVDKAEDIKDGIKKKADDFKENREEKKRQDDLKKYNPIFASDVVAGLLKNERVIRIVNYDKRLENETCKDSIGFFEITENRRLPTIYSKNVDLLQCVFFPQKSESVFISDPCVEGKYIEIDEYYNYMKQVRVNELTVIAQALGAKRIVIRLNSSEKESANFAKEIKADGKGKGLFGGLSLSQKGGLFRNRSISVWADTKFKTGVFSKNSSLPTVMYFRNESDISSLIQMVIVNKSKITERAYQMEATSSSGMSLSEAKSISASLKKIHFKAGKSFEESAARESHARLEYYIEF